MKPITTNPMQQAYKIFKYSCLLGFLHLDQKFCESLENSLMEVAIDYSFFTGRAIYFLIKLIKIQL